MEDHSTTPHIAALTEREAARYIGMSVSFLRICRARSLAPAYLKLGRAIRYRCVDLDAFLDARVVTPGANDSRETGAAA